MEIRPSYRLRKLFWCLTAIGGLLMLAVALLSGFLSYLQSPKFVQLLESQLGQSLGGSASMSEVNVKLQGADFQEVKFETALGLQGTVKEVKVPYQLVKAMRSGTLEVPKVQIQRADLVLKDASSDPSASGKEVVEVLPPEPMKSVSWWLAFLPTQADVREIEVEHLRWRFELDQAPLDLGEMSWRFKPDASFSQFAFEAWKSQGTPWTLPGMPLVYHVHEARGRLEGSQLHVNDIKGRVGRDGTLQLSGGLNLSHLGFWHLQGELADLKTQELPAEFEALAAWFDARIQSRFEASPDQVQGKVELQEASSPSPLPLRLLGELLRTDRLRSLKWDQASVSFEQEGELLRLKQLVLESQGMLRLEGDLQIDRMHQEGPHPLSGELWVGIAKEALRWVPSLEKEIFRVKREDTSPYVWTKVRLSGTTERPVEDLSPHLQRVLASGVLELTGRATGLLSDLISTATSNPPAASSEEKPPAEREKPKALSEEVLDQGNRLIEGVLPLLPFGK